MKRLLFFSILLAMGIGLVAQTPRNTVVDLEQLGATLRSRNLCLGYGHCFKDGMLTVLDTTVDKFGIMNLQGELLLPCEYTAIGFLQHSKLIIVLVDDTLSGVMNDQLQWVVRPFNSVYLFDRMVEEDRWSSYPHLQSVPNADDRWGLLDSLGHWLIPPSSYERLAIVDGDRGWVLTEQGLYDYRQQRIIIKDVNEAAKDGDNRYRVSLNNHKFGLLDTLGHWILEPRYGYMGDANDGMIRVKNPAQYHGLYGFIDTLGREQVPVKYQDVFFSFQNGYVPVKREGKWGYVNKQGHEVIPCQYDGVCSHIHNGRAVVTTMIGDVARRDVIDTNGNLLWSSDHELYESSDHALLWRVSQPCQPPYHPGEFILTDWDGHVLTRYDEVFFEEGDYYSDEDMIVVTKDGKWGLADKDYRLLVPCQYRWAEGYAQGPGAIVTLQDGTTRYIDRQGKTLFQMEGLESVTPISNGLYRVAILNHSIHSYLLGLTDGKGHSTFSPETLQNATKLHLQLIENYEQDAKERQEAQAASQKSQPATAYDGTVDTSAGAEESVDEEESAFVLVETDPEFPGGMDSLYAFLQAHITYPAEARKEKLEGRVYVQFVVEKNGTISNFRCLRDIGGGSCDEVKRVVGLMPRWSPGKEHGKPVRTVFYLPVNFELSEQE